jgi:hypothetical protein
MSTLCIMQALPEVVSQGIHHAQTLGQEPMPEPEEYTLHGMYGDTPMSNKLVTCVEEV